jgi:hypothetical protein
MKNSKIIDILTEISLYDNNIHKLNILETHKYNVLFKDILYLAYSPIVKYNIDDIFMNNDIINNNNISLHMAICSLKDMLNMNITKKNIISLSKDTLCSDDIEIIKMIIYKDLCCGITVNIINIVFPELIEIL